MKFENLLDLQTYKQNKTAALLYCPRLCNKLQCHYRCQN